MSRSRYLGSLLRSVLSLSVVFLSFQQSGQAEDALKYFKNNFITGDYVVGGVGLRGTGTPKLGSSYATGIINIGGNGPNGSAAVPELNGMPADVEGAYLYWNSIEASSKLKPSAFEGYFNGNKITGQPVGNQQNLSCEGTPQAWYSRVYRADVLKYLPFVKITDPKTGIVTFKYKANAQHTVDLLDGGATGILTNGASLVLIYRVLQPGNPRVLPLKSVVIYEGASTDQKADQAMAGFYQASQSGSAAKMTMIVGNGQPSFKETLNVTDASGKGNFKDPFVGSAGPRWDNPTVTFGMKNNDSDFGFHVTGNVCLTYSVAVMSTQVVDTDFDGILDVLETKGMHFNPGDATHPATFGTCADYPAEKSKCLNFPAMGANPNRPDIFVEMDWMKHGALATDEHKPKFPALKAVAEAVAKPHPPTFPQGIAIHFDVGNNYQGNSFIVPWKDASGNVLAQGGEVIDEATLKCPTAFPDPDGCAFPNQSVLSWKKGFQYVKNGLVIKKNGNFVPVLPTRFNSLRDDTFHYMLLAHALATYQFDTISNKLKPTNPGKSNSGVGDFGGGDSMLTFGLWVSDDPLANQTGSETQQAGTILHELGHNLVLGHAGDYGIPPCGPGYASVMNYMYQTKGLTRLPTDPVAQTGAQIGNTNEYVDLSSGNGKQKPLDETSLSEAQNSMGTLAYRVRFYGPPITGEAEFPKRFCDGVLNDGSIRPLSKAVRDESTGVSVPDWNRNNSSDAGPVQFDVNFNGTLGDGVVFLVNGAPKNLLPDTNDWASLNLQQVGARRNVGGQSLGVAGLDLGTAGLDLGNAGLDLGTAGLDLGNAGLDLGTGGLDLGNAGLDLGTAGLDLGVAGLDLGVGGLDLGVGGLDLGTAGLDLGTAGLDLGAELDQDTNNSSTDGTLNNLPPALQVLCSDSPTCANGSDRIRSTWFGPPPDQQIRHFKVYRFDPDHTTAVLVATLDSKNDQPLPSPISYDNIVNDFVNSGKACGTAAAPVTVDRGTHNETTTGVATCFNTSYTFYIVSENNNGGGAASQFSAAITIQHVYLIATDYSDALANAAPAANSNPSVGYGVLPIPPTTFIVRPSGTVLAGAECHYATSGPLTNGTPRNVNTYPIDCTSTAATVPGTPPAGVSFQQPYNDGTGATIVRYVPGKLKINKAPLTITAQQNTKIYDGTDKASLADEGTKAKPTVSGLKYDDTAPGSGLAETYDNKNVLGPPSSPNKVLSVSAYLINDGNTNCTFANHDSCNYAITTNTNTNGIVTPRPVTLTVKADPQSKIYGNPDPPLTYQVTSVLQVANGDTFSGALSRTPGENVGFYDILQNTLTLGDNYTIDYVGAKLEITPRPITVKADPKSKVYGNADPALTYQVTSPLNLVFGDTFSGALSRDPGENVGLYNILQNTLALSSNYTLTYTGDKLEITPRPITVKADPKSKVYGNADPALTYQVTSVLNLVNGDTFSGGLSRVAGENVGLYNLLQNTLALSSNYTLTYVGDKLEITPRPVTVKADPKTKVFGSADPALTFQITLGSLVSGDNFSGALSRVVGEDVGLYNILQNTLTLGTNYTLTYLGDKLEITPQPVVVTLSNMAQNYTGSPLSPTVTTVPLVSYVLTGAPQTDPGTYAVSATVNNPNYVGAAAGNFKINQAGTLTGAIERINPPPASVAPNVYESNTKIRFFAERTYLSLPVAATASITAPGTYGTTFTSGSVAAGTVVDTYYVHADQIGTSGSTALTGTITFDTDVLAIQTGNVGDGLSTQSSVLGVPSGTSYAGVGTFELSASGCPADNIVLSADRRTVTVCSTTSTHADDIRIIVQAH